MSDVIKELRTHIQTLKSKVYFLQEELKEKSFLLTSLITVKENVNNVHHFQQKRKQKIHANNDSSKTTTTKSKNSNSNNNKNNRMAKTTIIIGDYMITGLKETKL